MADPHSNPAMSAEQTVSFVNHETGDEAVVRVASASVGLALSLRTGGDVEVFLSPDDARSLLDALAAATAEVETPVSP